MKIKSFLKKICPSPMWSALGNSRRIWISRNDHTLSAREVFSRIYEKNVWGGDGEYSSGDGSRDAHVVQPYLERISQWTADHDGSALAAVDLGCGDFHIGKNLFQCFKSYTGIDLVPFLIEKHRREYDFPNLGFKCVDAIEEPLPGGDVIFVRQVLQHLSNDQISRILPKLRNYRFAIITEHRPDPSRLIAKNLDKPHGGGIRLAKGSGVYFDEAPFPLGETSSEILLDVPASDNPLRDGRIITTCYKFGG
jgi:hypothetical protein